ncbi:hypothetical protein G7B40_012545 [Aetokthonos hydrillicola Thurmond2011]|uniref:ACT domain-containing protein n=1 Tax=Aetokthonos hydrillicola Thurmond2011 TaxID=2712845 RepID=A0AAP5I5W2_9CYAN|nr:ACT domain-containing protein [Aetokthonos hydrillicola]MDR9895391.1 hypothetical protein [Aetokthonos hydrillicola Thurmond2011]
MRKWHKSKYATKSKPTLLQEDIPPIVKFSFISVDRIGILKDIIEKFYKYKINVQSVDLETNTNGIAKINLCIESTEAERLNECVREVARISDILDFKVL